MDDFLHNLRKNTDRNYEKRRSNPQYRGPERRGLRDQQHRPFQRRTDSSEMMAEVMPELKSLLTRIEESQKKIVELTERSVEATERQADIFETIAVILQRWFESGSSAPAMGGTISAKPLNETVRDDLIEESVVAAPTIMDRDEVIDLIVSLREGGMTYKEIAQRLEDENIPTFSGKGAWHAQTVHKVCNKGL